jgi:hypothetical protein
MQEMKTVDEGHWDRFRIQWADFRNAHRGETSTIVFPTDLVKLSFDKPEEPVKKVTFKEAKAQLGSKFKKDGGK